MTDIDNFKRRNDQFGHAAGDDALRTLGRILTDCVRIPDTAARVSGEEFALLLHDTDAQGASRMANAYARCCESRTLGCFR
jgi:diguanylate cyclase (GGDEF)-like protein